MCSRRAGPGVGFVERGFRRHTNLPFSGTVSSPPLVTSGRQRHLLERIRQSLATRNVHAAPTPLKKAKPPVGGPAYDGYLLNGRAGSAATPVTITRGAGAGAVSATGSLLLPLLPSGYRAVPYVAVGGGLDRAMFDLNHQRFFGGMGSTYAPGTTMTPVGLGYRF